MNRAKNTLLVLYPLTAVAAVVAGVVASPPYADAGIALLVLDPIRRALAWTAVGTVAFTAVYSVLRHLLDRRLRPALATASAAALAGAPFVALAGYSLNRARAVRPSEILEPWALWPNLLLLAACGAAYGVVCLVLHWAESLERTPSPRWALAALAVLGAAHVRLEWAWTESHKDDRPDVLVLLVDALRADHLGAYGYARETSPALDAVARDGVVFRQAISQSTFTKTSIASLFTGKNPYRHGVYWGQRQLTGGFAAHVLRDEERTLAESFQRRGYLTGAWVQNSHLREVMGFAQGFVEYHDQQGAIERIHRAFGRFLDGPARSYSFFAYLHYIDLHDPYRPPPPYDTLFGTWSDVYRDVDFDEWGAHLAAVQKGEVTLSGDDVEQLRALYDGQIKAIDDEIGRLTARLKELGLYDETLIVVTADHGDGFLEHGFISHSTTPYDELVRVPLILKLPGGRFAGREVSEQVRLVDLMPTLLEAAGAPVPPGLDGCNLLPLVDGGALDERCALAVVEIADENSYPTLALRTGAVKFIHQAEAGDELYDLALDPGETTNLAELREEDARAFRELALELVGRRAQAESTELDGRAVRELKALGYIGGGEEEEKRDEDEKRGGGRDG